MKIRWLLCLAACFLLVMPFGHAMSTDAAKERMYQACQTQLGYSKTAVTLYQFAHQSGGGWAFSLFVKAADPATNGLITGELTEDGQVRRLTPPEPISLYQQMDNELMRCQQDARAVYALVQTWRPKVQALSAAEQAAFDQNSQFQPLLAFVQHDIRLPSDDDISIAVAKAKAEEAILALPGWTQEKLNHIRIWMAVYHVPMGSDRPVYQFVYGLASSMGHKEALLSGQKYTFNYDKAAAAENRLFGEALPYVVSVRIDAQTGAVVGHVHIEIPPVTHGSPVFYILEE